MKKLLIIFLFLLCLFTFSFLIQAESIKIYPAQPVVITAPGQNPDGIMIKVVLDQQGIDYNYLPFLQANELDNYPTLILAIGHSCKGVGAAGVNFAEELTRTKNLIQEAKNKGKFIIITHLGGTGRREERSDNLLNIAVPNADYLIISKESNFDNYFSKAAQKYNIPLAIAENLSRIKPILAKLFKSQSQEVAYFINGDQKEPTIFINAGTHGDEIAGYQTALKMLEPVISGGRIIVIPRANPAAIAAFKRNAPGLANLNRAFPGNINGTQSEKRAAEIFTLIEKFSPDLVLDLHEAEEFNYLDKNQLGQSIIAYQEEETVWQGAMVTESLNEKITDLKEKFVLITYPVSGSLTWAVGKNLNIPAYTIETCRKLPLNKRVDYQIKIITSLLSLNGVEVRWP